MELLCLHRAEKACCLRELHRPTRVFCPRQLIRHHRPTRARCSLELVCLHHQAKARCSREIHRRHRPTRVLCPRQLLRHHRPRLEKLREMQESREYKEENTASYKDQLGFGRY
jgi:hypothetical protein